MKFSLLFLIIAVSALANVSATPVVEIAKLNDDSFAVRSTAHQTINDWCDLHSDEAIPFLYRAYKGSVSPEVKSRLLDLLKSRVLLAEYGKEKGFVGIHMENTKSNFHEKLIPTVSIISIQTGSPADKFGLIAGDAIISVDGKPFDKEVMPSGQFRERVITKSAGDKIVLKLLRNKELLSLQLTLGAIPEALELANNRRLGIKPRLQKQKYFENWLLERNAEGSN